MWCSLLGPTCRFPPTVLSTDQLFQIPRILLRTDSPVVANIYMEMFEELALRTATHQPWIWRHYVDDTFCVITKTEVEGLWKRACLLPLSPSVNHRPRGEYTSWRGPRQRSPGREWISWDLCKDGQQTPHSERASRGALSNSVHPLCSMPKRRCEVGMQKIQYPNSLSIGIQPPWTTDKSQGPRPTGEEVGSCVPDPLQLQPCIYRGDEENPWDQHKGAQSCHQTGKDREITHSRARLGTTSPNTVGGN